MANASPIAVLGAGGTMGLAMARNLALAGYEVRGWNRSREKAEAVTAAGGAVFESPAAAAQGAGVVLTMLADTAAVTESVPTALAATADGAIWLQMSTIGEAGTERCIELAETHGVALVDAPVLGTKQPAEEGKLVILASGPERLRERVQPILDVLGQRTLWVGAAGAGTRLKIVANGWVVTVVEGVAEALALAEGLGLDPQLLFDALQGGPLDMPYLRIKGKAMLERNFEPMFRLSLAAKDAGLIEESAARHDLDLPLFSTIHERMAAAVPEHGDQDLAATYLTSARV